MSDEYNEAPAPPPGMPMYDKTLTQAQQLGSIEVSALPHRPTVSEMLLAKKQHLEYQLQVVNEAIRQGEIQKDAMILIDCIAKAQIREPY